MPSFDAALSESDWFQALEDKRAAEEAAAAEAEAAALAAEEAAAIKAAEEAAIRAEAQRQEDLLRVRACHAIVPEPRGRLDVGASIQPASVLCALPTVPALAHPGAAPRSLQKPATLEDAIEHQVAVRLEAEKLLLSEEYRAKEVRRARCAGCLGADGGSSACGR